jgi:Rieske Fe-S protein
MKIEASAIVSPERREFLVKALTAGAVVCCGSVLGISFAGCGSGSGSNNPASALPAVSPIIDLSSEPALQTIGGAVKKHISGLNNDRDIIIIRVTTTGFAAFTSICTHQQNEINLPSAPGGNMVCPAHGSQFRSADGSVALGPASLPLTKFNAAFDQAKNTVTIS